ncbi:hypothetical protein R3P38DRAFT_3196033 [Favolaschia claudopus]|uniref:Uncharacterized protein n=1 Tax=Favolaschia claudopus TaxID=2862362 RepID=A0AAW0B9Q0_9AGAR
MSDAPARIRLWDHNLALLQSQQINLALYNSELHCIFLAYWPVDDDGNFLSPRATLKLVQDNKLHWPCFCRQSHWNSTVTPPTPSSIILDGDKIFVYCHYAPESRCSFFNKVALHEIYKTATLTHRYSDSLLSQPPYSESVQWAYFKSPHLDVNKNIDIWGPHQLPGYIGDYNPEVKQLAHVPWFKEDLRGRAGPYHFVVPVVADKQYVDAAVQTEADLEDDHLKSCSEGV